MKLLVALLQMSQWPTDKKSVLKKPMKMYGNKPIKRGLQNKPSRWKYFDRLNLADENILTTKPSRWKYYDD